VYGNDYVVNLGLSKKQTIILNGTGKDSLCIETEMGKECDVYDTFGGKVTRSKVSPGITRVNVPIGGYAIVEGQN
jgi:hypothetical protein